MEMKKWNAYVVNFYSKLFFIHTFIDKYFIIIFILDSSTL